MTYLLKPWVLQQNQWCMQAPKTWKYQNELCNYVMTVHPNINFNHNTRRWLERAHVLQIIIFWYYLLNCPPNHKAETIAVKAEDKRPAQRVYIQSLTSFRYWWSFPSCTNMRRIPSQALQRVFSCSRFNQWDEKWLTDNEDRLANTSRTTLIASRWGCSYSIQDISNGLPKAYQLVDSQTHVLPFHKTHHCLYLLAV